MNNDNPASRLYEILKTAKGIPGDQYQRNVWKSALKMEQCTDSQLFAQLGKLMALPEQINLWLTEKFPTKDWVEWKSAVDSTFSKIHLNSQWASTVSNLNDRALTELDMISTLYEKLEGMNTISNEDIEAYIEKINALKAEVLGSKMSLGMKKTFLRYLNKILDALESYHITGADPIMEAAESAIGHIAVDPEYRDAMKQSEAGEQLVNFLGSVIDAVASVHGLPPVIIPFLKLIKPD